MDLNLSKLREKYATPFKPGDLERKSSEIVLGRGIPARYKNRSPWQHPKHANPQLNELLDYSVRVQSGKAVDIVEFEDFVVSNCCFPTTGLMFGYLKHLGIKSRIATGNIFGDRVMSHAWLEIDGLPVETAFVADHGAFGDDVFERKSRWNYDIKIKYEDADDFERQAAFTVMTPDVSPNMAMYDLLMRRKLKEMSGKDVVSVSTKWEKKCWQCGAVKGGMLKCGGEDGCRAARYCDERCQRKDWVAGHGKLHAERRTALERREREAGSRVMFEYFRRRQMLEMNSYY